MFMCESELCDSFVNIRVKKNTRMRFGNLRSSISCIFCQWPALALLIAFLTLGNSLCHASVHGQDRDWETNSITITPPSNCSCDYDEILKRVPYFLQAFSQTKQFDFAFQGPKGERGFDGPVGPPGPEGRIGRKGQKEDGGEPGKPGLPGASHVTVLKGRLGPQTVLSENLKGHKGEQGAPGDPGKRGPKGERGEIAGFVQKNGQWTFVKGAKGDQGRRGRKGESGERGETGTSGLPGTPGLSILGEKGSKGEPAEIPDLELLRGPVGPRGLPGLPGPPGLGGQCGGVGLCKQLKDAVVSVKGDRGPKGEPGEPGLPGPPGPSGLWLSGSVPYNVPGALRYEFLEDLILDEEVIDSKYSGTLGFVEETEQMFIRANKGWKEILLRDFERSERHRLPGNSVPLITGMST